MSADDEVIELEPYNTDEDSVDEARPMALWLRLLLLSMTLPWLAVFVTACFLLTPYDDEGPLKMGTHQQLGLPECNFKTMFEVPCPSCGMTTSFSLLLHADVWNSLKANFAGTALASFGLLFIPWAFASAFFGRFMFIRRLELIVFRLAVIFLIMLFGRWSIVLAMEWLASST